jgi:hypothetical protein
MGAGFGAQRSIRGMNKLKKVAGTSGLTDWLVVSAMILYISGWSSIDVTVQQGAQGWWKKNTATSKSIKRLADVLFGRNHVKSPDSECHPHNG